MDSDSKIILFIIIFITAIFMIIMIYIVFNTSSTITTTIECPVDYCATNVFTGVKTCPSSGQTVSVNSVIEVCNPSNSCVDTRTPYALLMDGSTDANGQCDEDQCRCVNRARCPDYITSKFIITDGNPLLPLDNQRLSVSASTVSTNSVDFATSNIILNGSNEFCAVSLDFIQRSVPGCNNIISSIDDVVSCFNQNPCLDGVIAFNTSNIDGIPTNQQLFISPIECVVGKQCATGQLSYYNKLGLQCLDPSS